jgi:hypothetical protein
MNLAYLVHEHLNESWSALYHADVVADFSPTRLSYACAAHIADDLDETSIPITTHEIVAGMSDGVWRETVKDFLVGRSFRRDIFVRGPIKLTQVEWMKELDRVFILVVPRSTAAGKISTPMGEVEGRSDLYPVVLDLLAGGPQRLSQLRARATGPAKDAAVLIQALALLIHSGRVRMVRADAEIDGEPARRLNLALAREIEAGRAVHALAAPAIATGVPAELTDFGLVVAKERGLNLDAGTIARTTWEMIEDTSIRPTIDGKAIQQESDVLALLTQAADRLVAEKLEILKTLGI